MGLLFELPVAILAVTQAGIITTRQLRANRRYAVAACAAVAALLPGDAITMLLETVPLYLLFEVSLLVAGFAERRAGARELRAAPAAAAALGPVTLPGSTSPAAPPMDVAWMPPPMHSSTASGARGRRSSAGATLPGSVLAPVAASARSSPRSGLLAAVWVIGSLTHTLAWSSSTVPRSAPGTRATSARILLHNSLVLALHAMACVAGFIAGSSLPLQASAQRSRLLRAVHEHGGQRRDHVRRRRHHFSLSVQALTLGQAVGRVSFALHTSPGLLLLALLPHALPGADGPVPAAGGVDPRQPRRPVGGAARGHGGDRGDGGADAGAGGTVGDLRRAARAASDRRVRAASADTEDGRRPWAAVHEQLGPQHRAAVQPDSQGGAAAPVDPGAAAAQLDDTPPRRRGGGAR